ncbi:MAG: sigma factor-like helix-turn-helix DNA-binding protein, partial [Sphingomonas sp.]
KFEELPPRAIAERLGLSLSTVEKHLSRGILLLSRALRDLPVPADPAGSTGTSDAARRQA